MMNGFNMSIHVKETRAVWKQQLIAAGLVVSLSIVMLAGLALIVGSEYLLAQMVEKEQFEIFWIKLGKWSILGALFLVIIAAFYRFGPAKRRHRIFISPGVWLAAILTISTSLLFSWYVNNFGNYNSLYGSLGTIMVVLLWIYFNCTMLLIGFELDAGIYSAREKHRSLLEQEEMEEAIKVAAEEETEKAVRDA
jgi:membrane protein